MPILTAARILLEDAERSDDFHRRLEEEFRHRLISAASHLVDAHRSVEEKSQTLAAWRAAREQAERRVADLATAATALREARTDSAGRREPRVPDGDDVETERRRIGRLLHDTLSQQLTATILQVEACRLHLSSDPATADAALGEAVDSARRASADLRRLLAELRGDGAPSSSAGSLRDQLVADCAARGISADVRIEAALDALPPAVRHTVLDVAREAVSNALKHSGAASLRLVIHAAEDACCVRISDDGRGFSAKHAHEAARALGKLGLNSMRERVAALGGELTIESQPGLGTTVTASVPLPAGRPMAGAAQ